MNLWGCLSHTIYFKVFTTKEIWKFEADLKNNGRVEGIIIQDKFKRMTRLR
jgi:hypothetical protein